MIRVVSEMLKSRHRLRTFDGLIVRDQLDSTPEGMLRSVVVERVEPGTPAELANIQKGDAIVRLGDVTVNCSYDVDRALLDRNANDHLALVVRRQSQETKTELVLQGVERSKTTMAELVWKKLGIAGSPLKGELVSRANAKLRGGLEVSQSNPNGAAAQAGISKGDILVGLKEWETMTLDNVAYVLSRPDLRSLMPLNFWIIRGGTLHQGMIKNMD